MLIKFFAHNFLELQFLIAYGFCLRHQLSISIKPNALPC